VSLLEINVVAGETGPVLVLSGESDLTTLDQLNSALDKQLWADARFLTVDLSGLRFADSATVAALAQTARTLRDQGGRLELLRPQPAVARVLDLMGIDQILTVRDPASGKGSSLALSADRGPLTGRVPDRVTDRRGGADDLGTERVPGEVFGLGGQLLGGVRGAAGAVAAGRAARSGCPPPPPLPGRSRSPGA